MWHHHFCRTMEAKKQKRRRKDKQYIFCHTCFIAGRLSGPCSISWFQKVKSTMTGLIVNYMECVWGKKVTEHLTSSQKGKCHIQMIKRQAPPETDSNIWIDLRKCLSISTDYKNDISPSFACFRQVPAVRGNEAEASCLIHTCMWEIGQRNASFSLHWVRK